MSNEQGWVSVLEELRKHGQIVFVRIGSDYAVAESSKDFGFSAESSGYEVTALDDSGLDISLSGEVTHWKRIED